MFGKKKKKNTVSLDEGKLGSELSFAASEAYKLLRTNITLSLPNGKCNAVGITSSGPSEGKSTTAMNLAYTFAVSDKKVLLIEADMRKPTISTRLQIEQTPGLSNLLVNQNEIKECLKTTTLHKNVIVLSAGDVPPNPSELLSSDNMKNLIEQCKEVFDVIIVDLPPINVVTDALVVSTVLDGTMVVVRSDVTKKREVAEVVKALEFAKAKVLGFILTDTSISKKHYGRYGKYYGTYK